MYAYKNQCVAVAEPHGKGVVISASGPSQEETSNRALTDCKKKIQAPNAHLATPIAQSRFSSGSKHGSSTHGARIGAITSASAHGLNPLTRSAQES
ncbi:DUF4189 domain-containing protein [Xanthomonas axonopodis]|uniref:DUF4189 domain-containing protein n=1 Tax=Xanthomonas axonopodis TaxID=53413 RepID=UPI0013DDBBEA